MKKLIINLTLILGFSLFTGGCEPIDTMDISRTLEGRVRDGFTYYGVSGVTVTANEIFGDEYDKAVTGKEGRFVLTYVGPSNCTLCIEAPGGYTQFKINNSNSLYDIGQCVYLNNDWDVTIDLYKN